MTKHNMRMARFFVDCCGNPPAVWQPEFERRFPNATDEDMESAVAVAAEILREDAAEYFARANALQAKRWHA